MRHAQPKGGGVAVDQAQHLLGACAAAARTGHHVCPLAARIDVALPTATGHRMPAQQDGEAELCHPLGEQRLQRLVIGAVDAH